MAANPYVAKNPEMVVVACKIPFGLHLDLPLNDEDTNRVTIAGSSHPEAVCGYGLTRVPKEFFQEWLTRNAELPMVKKGLVFAHKDDRSARAEAIEKKALRSGFEGVNPEVPKDGAGGVKVGIALTPESYEGYTAPQGK
jgi:hypothetical protein